MILVERDINDKVVAYIDYEIVNSKGKVEDDGTYCYVRDAWIHKSFSKQEGKRLLKWFIAKGHSMYPQVEWLYFERGKYNDRTRIYKIRRMY